MYDLAADIARDGEINMSYVQTAEMLVDCFTMSLPKPDFLKQCATMGMIGIGLGNGLGTFGNGLRIGLGNALGSGPNIHRNGLRNGVGNGIEIAIGNDIRNAVGKQTD
jgi:hypothetical protein